MSVVFDALPGVEVTPDAIARGLAQLWAREGATLLLLAGVIWAQRRRLKTA